MGLPTILLLLRPRKGNAWGPRWAGPTQCQSLPPGQSMVWTFTVPPGRGPHPPCLARQGTDLEKVGCGEVDADETQLPGAGPAGVFGQLRREVHGVGDPSLWRGRRQAQPGVHGVWSWPNTHRSPLLMTPSRPDPRHFISLSLHLQSSLLVRRLPFLPNVLRSQALPPGRPTLNDPTRLLRPLGLELLCLQRPGIQ